jgi:hypothetical protein
MTRLKRRVEDAGAMYAIAANYNVGEFRLAMRYRRLPGRNSDLRLLATHGRDASVPCNAMRRALRRRSIHLIQGDTGLIPSIPWRPREGRRHRRASSSTSREIAFGGSPRVKSIDCSPSFIGKATSALMESYEFALSELVKALGSGIVERHGSALCGLARKPRMVADLVVAGRWASDSEPSTK